MTNKVVSSRGIMLCRQIGGVSCSDSMLIEFGNDATVSRLIMNWKVLSPYQKVKAFNKSEIVNQIKSGNVKILPDINGDIEVPPHPKTLTITKATPVYRYRNAKEYIFPCMDIEAIVDEGKTNAVGLQFECPIVPH
jgi:hypothetical protein